MDGAASRQRGCPKMITENANPVSGKAMGDYRRKMIYLRMETNRRQKIGSMRV